MKWRGRRTSSNVEDRRGGRRTGAKRAGGGLGLGAIIIMGASIFFPDAVPLLQMFGIGGQGSSASSYRQDGPVVRSGVSDDHKEFAEVVLGDTEEIWNQIFAQPGLIYKESSDRYPQAVLVCLKGEQRRLVGPPPQAQGHSTVPPTRKFISTLDFTTSWRGNLAQQAILPKLT